MSKKNIYLDLDGTCNVFEYAGPDKLADPDYYRNRPVAKEFVAGLKKLSDSKEYEFFIVSSAFEGKEFEDAKDDWVDKYMPFVEKTNRIYVKYGKSKLKAIKRRVGSNVRGIMVDDYTKNLHEFKDTEILPVKILNGINDTNRSWDGVRISAFGAPSSISYSIASICNMWA